MKSFARLLKQGASPTAIALWIKYTADYYPVRDERGRLDMSLYKD